MHAKRTRFATDIVAEVYEPKKASRKVVIFAPGMPVMPGGKSKLAAFFNKKGYWFIHPRYRGTWESGGNFLEYDPTQDIIDVIESLRKPSTYLPDGESFQIETPEIYVVGSSFGGAAGFIVSSHQDVHKVLTISGLVDWSKADVDEPVDWLFEKMMPEVFGNGYRCKDPDDWKKLLTGELYSPVHMKASIENKKILMIHSVDDTIVPYNTASQLSEELDIPLITLQGKGHAGSSNITKWKVWRKVKKHFES